MSFRLRVVPPRFAALGLVVALLAVPAACQRSTAPSGPLTLAQIDGGDQAKDSGKRLMALPLGLHRLDTVSPDPSSAVIAVHGYDSEGYEWAYPLKTTGDGGTRVYFYRWDYKECPDPMAAQLDRTIDGLLKDEPGIESLRIMGHSYGGMITSMVAADYDGRAPLLVDIVASPLAGHPGITRRCEYDGAKAPAEGAPVTIRQWRTIHELDKAFNDVDPDPQIVDLPGEVTRLPQTYRGHRLGHNWSISWVVDHLAGGAPP